MDLEGYFNKYKNITLSIMEVVKSDNYENLDELFKQRQLILNDINKLNSSKEEIKMVYDKCKIKEIEKVLEVEIKNRKEQILEQIKKSQKRKIAVNGYNNLQAKAVFLSKEL